MYLFFEWGEPSSCESANVRDKYLMNEGHQSCYGTLHPKPGSRKSPKGYVSPHPPSFWKMLVCQDYPRKGRMRQVGQIRGILESHPDRTEILLPHLSLVSKDR